MSYIEFQISTKAFLAAQLSNLQNLNIQSPSPVSVGSYQIILDHVEFGANAVRHNVAMTEDVFYTEAVYGTLSKQVSGFVAQLAQDVTLYLADLNDVLAHPNAPPSLLLPVPATFVMNLKYFLTKAPDCQLTIELDHVELGQLPPLPPGIDQNFVTQQLTQFAQQNIQNQSSQFDLTQAILGAGAVALNAGCSIDSTLSRIAFRAQTGGGTTDTPNEWQDFFNGNVPDRLQGADWGFHLDAAIFSQLVATPIQQGIAKSSQFHLVTGVTGNYSNPAPNRAHVQVPFGGNVDAPICSAYVDVTIDLDVTVSAPNTLSVDTNISHQVQGTACTITAAILGAALGGLVDLLFPFLSEVINPMTGFAAGMAAALYVEATYVPSQSISNCQQLSDTHYSCTMVLPVKASTPLGSLAFTALLAQSDGVSLTGVLQTTALTTAGIKTGVSQFVWQAPGVSCGIAGPSTIGNFTSHAQQLATAVATIEIDDTGTAPLDIGNYAIQNDPLNVFQNARISLSNTKAPAKMVITAFYPGAQYYQKPYPFELLINTNGGTRLISIDALPPLTAEIIQQMEGVVAQQVASCEKIVDPWFNFFHGYNPVWSVDPPAGVQIERVWDVSIIGLPEAERAGIVDTTTGQTVMTATAIAGVATRMSALTGASENISIVHEQSAARTAALAPEPKPTPKPVQRGIAVTERLLLQRALIALGQKCRRIGVANIGSKTIVFAVMLDRLAAYDLSRPSQPRLFGAWSVRGIQGALGWRGGLLAFGAAGFTTIGADGAVHVVAARHPILDAVANGDGLVASAHDTIDVYSSALALQSSVPASAARLVRVGAGVMAAEPGKLSLLDVANPLELQRNDNHLAIDAVDVVPLPDSGAQNDVHSVVAVSPKGSSVVALQPNGAPKVIGTFAGLPWFYNSVNLPALLVRLTPDLAGIRVSGWGASKTI